jgi:uncharacterized protein DUF4372/DDE family transposase
MNLGRTVFSQLIAFLPDREFRRCVARYEGDARLRGFSCWDQYLSMAFAQLTYRESLRDIEACLGALGTKLYHLGFQGKVARSTLADANESRDWRIFADCAHVLIRIARPLCAADPIGVDLDQSLYALDSTTIDLCLSLFPWAKFRKHKAAIKMHTLLDLHGNIPTFIRVTDGKAHDVNILDEIFPETGAFYVMDRGYIDFDRLFVFTLASAFFVIRTKENVLLQRRYSHPVDKSTGVRSDHTVILTTIGSATAYPDALRRITYFDAETDQRLKFLTNNFTLPALMIAQIYKCRWQIELFFKWIKQHLRIKVVDECQILTLFCGEWRYHGRIEFRRRINVYLESVLAETLEDVDTENVNPSVDHRANGLFGGGVEIGAQLLRIGAGVLEIRDPCACVVDLCERPLPAVFALRLKRLSAE